MPAPSALAGRGIVVTRPARQAAGLAALISAHGGRPIVFPLLEITDIAERGPLNEIVDRLEAYHLAIFVSPNAASKGLEAIRSRRSFPPALEVAAIGRGTAREVERLGAAPVIAPEDAGDSEALLAHPRLERVAGQRIVIFRGRGGRELLRDTLLARGAQVDYAECYVRARPQADAAALDAAWGAGEIDAVVVTSSEGLRNLHGMLDARGRERLARTPVFVPHARIAASARALGVDRAVVTGAGDEGITASLMDYFARA